MGKICKWDDWWRHTRNPILYQAYKSGYLGQFAVQNIETWQADSSTGNSYGYKKFRSHGNSLFSSPHPLDFNMLVIFNLENVKQGHKLKLTYLYACWDHAYEMPLTKIKMERQRWPKKLLIWGGLEPSMLPELLSSYWKRILLQSIKHFWYKLAKVSLFIIFEKNLVECMTSLLG